MYIFKLLYVVAVAVAGCAGGILTYLSYIYDYQTNPRNLRLTLPTWQDKLAATLIGMLVSSAVVAILGGFVYLLLF